MIQSFTILIKFNLHRIITIDYGGGVIKPFNVPYFGYRVFKIGQLI